jgi:NADH-quinone oxidoreductase subunit C
VEPLQIAGAVKEKFPDDVLSIEEFRGQVSVLVKKNNIFEICRYLRENPEFSMDHLRDLSGADYLGKKDARFEVVYHLYSLGHRHMLRLRAQVPEDDCSLRTVSSIWQGAGAHERECYDLFGIVFDGHPDLRRILMPEDWEGHPLRKDYPVKGPDPENEWHGFREVLEKSKLLKEFDWNR